MTKQRSQRKPTATARSGQPKTASAPLPVSAVVMVMDRVYKPEADFTPNEIAVFIYLARRMDAHGQCWPSVQRIGDECHMSISTAGRVVRSLRKKNQITQSWSGMRLRDGKKHAAKTPLYTLVHNVASFTVEVEYRIQEAKNSKSKKINMARYILKLDLTPQPLTPEQERERLNYSEQQMIMQQELSRNEITQKQYNSEVTRLRDRALKLCFPGIDLSEVENLLDNPKLKTDRKPPLLAG